MRARVVRRANDAGAPQQPPPNVVEYADNHVRYLGDNRRDVDTEDFLKYAREILRSYSPPHKDKVSVPERVIDRDPADINQIRLDVNALEDRYRQVGLQNMDLDAARKAGMVFNIQEPGEADPEEDMMYLMGGGPPQYVTRELWFNKRDELTELRKLPDIPPGDPSGGVDISEYTLPEEEGVMALQGLDDTSTEIADPGPGTRLAEDQYVIPKCEMWMQVQVESEGGDSGQVDDDEVMQEAEQARKGVEDIVPPAQEFHTRRAKQRKETSLSLRGKPQSTINIRKFDYGLLRPDYTMVFYGKRRTGKTVAMANVMKALRPYFPEVYVFTETKVDLEYAPCVPDSYIFQGFDEDILAALLDRQEQRVRTLRKRGENTENIGVMLVFDDCITESKLKNSEVMRRLFYNGRHFYICTMINSQDQKALSPGLRANTDMAFLFRVKSQRDKEAVRTNYLDILSHNRELSKIMDPVSEIAFNVLCVDQSRPYMDTEDTVYVARFPDKSKIYPFFMGSKAFWGKHTSQLKKYGGEDLLNVDNWGIVNSTYKFKMTGAE